MEIKKYFFDFLAMFMIISLSFSAALPNLFLVVLILYFTLNIFKKENFYPKFISTFPFGILFFYLTIKEFYLNNYTLIDFKLLSRFTIVLIIPIILFNVSKIKIALAIIITSFTAMLIAIIKTIIYYLETKTIPFHNADVINKILFIERPYIGFLSLISIIICTFLIKELPKFKFLLLLLTSFYLLFIFLIVARLSMISIFLIGLIYLIFYSNIKAYKKVTIIISSIGIIIIVLFSYKNMSNRFLTNTSLERIKLYDPRIDIWDCSYQIVISNDFNSIFGEKSYQSVTNKLIDCYGTKSINDPPRRQWFIDSAFNTHNQFIDFYIIGGFLGLLFFIFFIFQLIYFSKNNFYYVAITLSLVIFMFFENIFHRQLGCYFVAIVFAFVTQKNQVVKSLH